MSINGIKQSGDDEYEAKFRENVLGPSAELPEGTPLVSGIEFNDYRQRNITVAEMVQHMSNTGYQASAVAEAARIINNMVSPDPHAILIRSLELTESRDRGTTLTKFSLAIPLISSLPAYALHFATWLSTNM